MEEDRWPPLEPGHVGRRLLGLAALTGALTLFAAAPAGAAERFAPDICGAVTIHQQLEKHRADATCASCHSKMDPPGFALESFDVMGGFRERYRAVSKKAAPVKGFGMNG